MTKYTTEEKVLLRKYLMDKKNFFELTQSEAALKFISNQDLGEGMDTPQKKREFQAFAIATSGLISAWIDTEYERLGKQP